MAHLIIYTGTSRIRTNEVDDILLAETFQKWSESDLGILLDIGTDSSTSFMWLPASAIVEWHFDIKVPFDGGRTPAGNLPLLPHL